VVAASGEDARLAWLNLRFEKAGFCYRGFPYRVVNAAGLVTVEGTDARIVAVEGGDPGSPVILRGTIQDPAGSAGVDLAIEAKNIPLDERLRTALDEETRGLWDDFSPEGRVDVSWKVSRRPGEKAEHRGVVRPLEEGSACTCRRVPLRITGLRGEIEYDRGLVRIHHATGSWRDARLELRGTAEPNGRLLLRLGTRGLRVDGELTGALPEPVRAVLQKIGLAGPVDVQLETALGGEETGYTLRAELQGAELNAPVWFGEVQGDASLAGLWREGSSEMRGEIHFRNARVEGRPVSNLVAEVSSANDAWEFRRIRGAAYGGTIQGRFEVDVATGVYGGDFSVIGLKLREFIRDTERFRDRVVDGRADLRLQDLRGQGDDLKSLRGRGTLDLRDGFLWNVPVFFSLWTINPQQIFRERNAFDAGRVEFEMLDGKFDVRSLALSNDEVNVIGRGEIGFGGELDLVLRARGGALFGTRFPGLDLLLSPLEQLREAFLGVRVTGNFDQPEAKLEMFPGIREADR